VTEIRGFCESASGTYRYAMTTIEHRQWLFRCESCGHEESGRAAPERCPECSGTTWAYERRRDVDANAPISRDDSYLPGVPFS
jgi:Zn finger protein HypA/HybF involved in hydrogenase expression